MVVSLTIIPVLAARFLGRRPMPTTGPIYNLLADGYEGLLRAGLRFPRATVLLALAGGRAGLVAVPAPGDRLHARHGRRGVRARLQHAGGHLAGPDRQGPAPGRGRAAADTPDISGYIRRTGAELGFFATESYTGDILVSLKPPGQRRPADEMFDELREELEGEVPELETEFVPLVQDQINDLAGVDRPIEVKVFGPDFATLRELAEQVGKIVEEVPGAADVNAHVFLGNPDIVVRPDSVQTARRRSDGDGCRDPSSTPRSTARWPARCPSRTG